jgi:hypothetical protein
MDVGELFLRLARYVVFFLALSKASTAGTIDPSTPDSKYLEFGKQFPWVVQLRNTIDCQKCQKVHDQLASAVLIKPNWALTAAHVVRETTNNVIYVHDQEFPLSYVVWHKEFEDAQVGFHDIALCYSPKEFGLKSYIPLYAEADEVGKSVTIAGWGSTGTFLTGATKLDSQRRAGHNKIQTARQAVLVYQQHDRPKRFALEFMIAPGDSGGGLFIGDKLAGINSFLTAEDKNADGTYTDESAFTRVSLYRDWIELQIEKYEKAMQALATTGADLDLEPATHDDSL